MRDVTIYKNPVAEPGCCSKCGSQHKDWFVDVGFDTIMNRSNIIKMNDDETPFVDNPIWLDGIIYLCCDCINNLMSDLDRRFKEFKLTHDVEVEFNGRDTSSDYSGADEDNQGTESNSPKTPSGTENPSNSERSPFSFV